MKYVTDGKTEETNTKCGDDIATRTLYTLAKRRDRRNYFSYSLIFLCVIFFLSIIVGCLLYIYAEKTDMIVKIASHLTHLTPAATVKTALKNYFLSFLPFALVFVLGFTHLSSLINGIICAFSGAFAGFSVMYVYKSLTSHYLLTAVMLGAYCFVLLYFSAVSVSFSHSLSPINEFDRMFEEDLACYLRYLLMSAALILAVCIIYHIF